MRLIFSISRAGLCLSSGESTVFISYQHIALGLDVISNPFCVHYHTSQVVFQLSSWEITGVNKFMDADNFYKMKMWMDNGSKKIILPCFKTNRKLKSASFKQIFLLILVRSMGKFPKNLETGMDLFLVILYFKVCLSTKVCL